MGHFYEDLQVTERQQQFWKDLPGSAAVLVRIPFEGPYTGREAGVLNYAQTRTIGALEILLGSGHFDVDVSIPARGHIAMPVGVFTVTPLDHDEDGNVEPSNQRGAVYLHPDGALRSFYYPAQVAR